MANTIKLKKSSVADKVPTTGQLDHGELALNYADGKLYTKNSSNVVVQLGGGSGGGIASIQTGYINDTRDNGVAGTGEDVSYYDIDLTASPYSVVDPDKSIVTFEGSFFYYNTGKIGGSTGVYIGAIWNVTSRIINNGQTLRLATLKDSGTYHFIGRWNIIEGS